MTRIGRPLNYYGSKERMARQILALVPPGPTTWVELFCGSAVVTLNKPRHPKEIINDLNGDIINLFEVLRSSRRDELLSALELTPYAEGELIASYETGQSNDPVERARSFLVESWLGRGGDSHKTGFRWSRKQNLSPELTWTKLPTRLAAVAERLRGVLVRSVDALTLLDVYDSPDCIIFIDPPYPGPVGRRYAVKMREDQHHALARRMNDSHARIILTMATDSLYQPMLPGWHVAPSRVITNGGTHKPEVIMTNFEPSPDLFSHFSEDAST